MYYPYDIRFTAVKGLCHERQNKELVLVINVCTLAFHYLCLEQSNALRRWRYMSLTHSRCSRTVVTLKYASLLNKPVNHC